MNDKIILRAVSARKTANVTPGASTVTMAEFEGGRTSSSGGPGQIATGLCYRRVLDFCPEKPTRDADGSPAGRASPSEVGNSRHDRHPRFCT